MTDRFSRKWLLEVLEDRRANYQRHIDEQPPLPKDQKDTVESWLNEVEHIIAIVKRGPSKVKEP
jgi:hypothetical protein